MAKILVIDDERNLRLLYQQDLERDGHVVFTAATAAEGFDLLDRERPDLVVLDIRMPGMDGIEALGRILEKHPKLPVILNTAYSSYQDNFLCWSADDYVIKSSDTTELRRKIRERLAARGDGGETRNPTSARTAGA
jgi:two-component system, response regulator, stage 0 sporulation protein F